MKHRILVVDDERQIAEQVASFLEENGFLTQYATSVREVFPAVWAFSPDLVIFDVDLAEQSGFRLAESLLSYGLVSEFVFITGDDASRKPPTLSKFVVLEKPFSLSVILDAVRSEFARIRRLSCQKGGA